MHNSRASGIVRRLSSAYAILIVIALSLIPIFATAYLYIYQDSQLIFHSHSDHVALFSTFWRTIFPLAGAWFFCIYSYICLSRYLYPNFVNKYLAVCALWPS